MLSMFLACYRNTCQSLGELEIAVETLACQPVFPQQSHSPKLPFKIYNRNSDMFSISYLDNFNKGT